MLRTALKHVLIVLTLLSAVRLVPQSIIKQIEVPGRPASIAVNPLSNRIYVTQGDFDVSGSNTHLSIIDGNTNTVIGAAPSWPDLAGNIAVDYVTENLYVVGCRDLHVAEIFCNLRVLDSSRQLIATFDDIAHGSPVAVNPLTHRLYYSRMSLPGLAVVDTRTNKYLGRISLNGDTAWALDVDLAGNRVFALAGIPHRVVVIDAHTSKVIRSIETGTFNYDIAVDPFRKHVYVTSYDEGASPRSTVLVLDSDTLALQKKITVGKGPFRIEADFLSGFVFVTNSDSETLSVINGNNLKLRKTIAGLSGPIGVNPYTRLVYTSAETPYSENMVGKIVIVRE